ncbi:hypothetical protein D3C72_762980 [compost metagenome]
MLWLEVENARKGGPEMRKLADAVCAVAEGAVHPLMGLQPNVPMDAYYAAANGFDSGRTHRLPLVLAGLPADEMNSPSGTAKDSDA